MIRQTWKYMLLVLSLILMLTDVSHSNPTFDRAFVEFQVVTTSDYPRNLIYNYADKKSSVTVDKSIEVLRQWDVPNATGTLYGVKVSFRFPLNLTSLGDELKNKLLWLKNNYGIYVCSGYLKVHICFNLRRIPCVTIWVWQK